MVSSSFFIKLFFILLISLLFVSIASAESGNVSVAQYINVNNYITGGTGADNSGFDYTKITIDNTNYNTFDFFNVTCTGFAFLHDSESTSFSVVSGGTNSGGGVVSMNKSSKTISWYFNTIYLTDNHLVLSYANNIFANISYGGTQVGADVPDIGTIPATIGTLVGPGHGSRAVGTNFMYYHFSGSVETTNSYVVSYPTSTSFNIIVNKSTIATKDYIHSQTVTYTSDNTPNIIQLSYAGLQKDGIYLNVTLAGGAYNDVLINVSGVSGYTPPPVPGTGGSLSGQVYFDYSTAALTYPYGINVSILAANWSDWFSPTFRIKVIAPGDSSNPAYTVSGFPIDFSAQYYNTSKLWNFEWVGTYNASLYNCGWGGSGCLLSDGTLMDTATLTIAQTPYTYSVTSDASSYSTGDIIRFNISNPSPQGTFFNMFLQRGTSGGTGEIRDLIVPASSVKYVNVTVTGDMTFGSWEGSLNTKQSSGSTLTDKVASKVFSISNPVPGSKVSVRWDSNFVLGETNNLYYTTNQNTSTVTVNKTLPGSNASFIFDTFTAYSTDTQPKQYLMDTVGEWIAKITDNGNASNTSTATITVAGISGCNKNMPDYVCWDKTTYLKGDSYVINYKATNLPLISLTPYVVTILIYDPDGILILNKTILNTISGFSFELPLVGMKSGSFKLSAKAGKWHAILAKGGVSENKYVNSEQLADSYAIVVDSTISTGGTNATSVPGTPRAIIDGWTALFGWGVNDVSRFFFALLFVTAGMFSGFMLSGKNLYGGVFGAFLPWAFFALPSVNYIPSWVTIFIAIIVALKIGWFK